MRLVKEHYDVRFELHQQLLQLFNGKDKNKYLKLALGIDEPQGNYSAHEHRLGEPILANNSAESIIALAQSFTNINSPREMIQAIYKEANIAYLKIGVGSEWFKSVVPHYNGRKDSSS